MSAQAQLREALVDVVPSGHGLAGVGLVVLALAVALTPPAYAPTGFRAGRKKIAYGLGWAGGVLIVFGAVISFPEFAFAFGWAEWTLGPWCGGGC